MFNENNIEQALTNIITEGGLSKDLNFLWYIHDIETLMYMSNGENTHYDYNKHYMMAKDLIETEIAFRNDVLKDLCITDKRAFYNVPLFINHVETIRKNHMAIFLRHMEKLPMEGKDALYFYVSATFDIKGCYDILLLYASKLINKNHLKEIPENITLVAIIKVLVNDQIYAVFPKRYVDLMYAVLKDASEHDHERELCTIKAWRDHAITLMDTYEGLCILENTTGERDIKSSLW